MWSLFWLTTGIAVVIVAVMCGAAQWLVPFFFGSQFDAAVTVTYIVLPGTVFLSARRVLSEGLKGRGYPLAGTVGELVSLAWIAVALAVLVPLWGINGAAFALTSSYVVSMLLLVGIAGRHGELESASGSLVSLPRDLVGAVRARARAPALQKSDRPAGVS
jgi:O-antigen/teichoic acid export membrane protein